VYRGLNARSRTATPSGGSLIPGEVRVPNLKTPLRRSRTDRMIAGVVAGLAKYFDLDPTLARVLYVVASIVSVAFPGLLVYIVLWVIVPAEE
jgi:phage shock protein C